MLSLVHAASLPTIIHGLLESLPKTGARDVMSEDFNTDSHAGDDSHHSNHSSKGVRIEAMTLPIHVGMRMPISTVDKWPPSDEAMAMVMSSVGAD